MRYQEVYDALHTWPFQPFTLQLSNGQSHTVRHPEFALLTRNSVVIGVPVTPDNIPDRLVQCDLLHVVSIEPANGVLKKNGKPKRKKK